MARTIFFILLSLFASVALARNANYSLTIVNARIAPDGVDRNATLANGTYPGPLLVAQKGDTLRVKVRNELTDPSMYRTTSIHWHGLLQHKNADDDGPAWVTHCPIVPQASYTYNIPLGNQTGTYWYHGHLASQYVDGLRGPLVIYPEDPHKQLYDVDDATTVLIIGDWYHSFSRDILTSGNITREQPDSATINGKGRFDPDNTPANPDTLYTLRVQRGKRYRLRVINSSALAAFRVSIQGHKLTVIAADGVPTQPYEVDEFDIIAGQRIDCVMEANQNPETYWINAPLTNVANKTAQALLVYEGDAGPYRPPKGAYNRWNVTDDIINYYQPKRGAWAINGIPYRSPDIPTLLRILTDNDTVTASDFPQASHTTLLPKDKCIELNITGNSGVNIIHPIHLHGHTFDVVQFGNNTPNYVNPPRRDVVGSTDAGVRIQFRTDNPGPWFMHCHIDWHLERGFAMIFAEAPEAIQQGPKRVHVNNKWRELCRKYEQLPAGFQ
ncbi:oxidorectuctase, putative [Rhizoctonia solani AG-3 Rhs1AP]|uniref:Oxidorectuctase, putative n=1 Tax=Rhizoctonia solani AG-3 Rhs1AP TaxID=1086054 RepID=X8JNA7_9AGAM|nr:oxidorectuctase, putative [Rhizoctonia solani AG-3 Rhs1AP]